MPHALTSTSRSLTALPRPCITACLVLPAFLLLVRIHSLEIWKT